MALVQTSPGLICVTHRLGAVADVERDDRARLARVTAAGRRLVGRRGAVLTSVPKKIVPVSASNEGVLQTELVAGPK